VVGFHEEKEKAKLVICDTRGTVLEDVSGLP
jgi:hypothetical protein